ncbi:MAG: BON domain-containing protein [Burkholderiaceae bacterium]|nr:BON domain-containing protein [Burkholderiaceae bacterium]
MIKRQPLRRLVRVALAALSFAALATSLPGCIPLLAGGAVVGGMAATDRRTSGAQVEDEGIELRASSRVRDALGERAHINITSYNRQVLITGEVPSEQDKQSVESLVSRVPNVRATVNELAVLGNSTLAQRSSDTLVTGKVKASLVDAKDLFANAFKVVTERGVVYLMGRVTPREAERATAITRSVGGVQRVVRILESITEDELKQMLPAAPKS